MNEKNIVLQNYAGVLMSAVNALMTCVNGLGDNETINSGIIKSAYVGAEAVKSNLTIFQNALDEYNKGV